MAGMLSQWLQNTVNSGLPQALMNFGGTLAANSGPGLQNHGQGLGLALQSIGPGMLQGQQEAAAAQQLAGQRQSAQLWNEAFGPQQTDDQGNPLPLSPQAQQLQSAVPGTFRPLISALGQERGAAFVSQLAMMQAMNGMAGPGGIDMGSPEGVRAAARMRLAMGDGAGAARLLQAANGMDVPQQSAIAAGKAAAEQGVANQMKPMEVAPGLFQTPAQAGITGQQSPFAKVPEPLQPTLALAAQQAQLPPAAVPHWLATIQQESGFNPSVKDSPAGAIGLGQVMPATGAAMGFTPEQLRHPFPNALASAKYFAQQWQAGGGDPTQAYLGYYGHGNAGPGQPTPGEYAQQVAQKAQAMGAQPQAPAPQPQAPISTMQPQQVTPDITRVPQPGGGAAFVNRGPEIAKAVQGDAAAMKDEEAATNESQAQLSRLQQIANLAKGLPTGAAGELRANLANSLATFLPPDKAAQMQKLAGLPDPASAQEFMKLAVTGAINQEKGISARGGVGLTKLLAEKANPNLEMQPQAIQGIVNSLRAFEQNNLDYDKAKQAAFNGSYQEYLGGGKYTPLSEFETQWNQQDRSKLLTAAVGAMNGTKGWDSGLPSSGPEALAARQQVLAFIKRIDPTQPIYHPGDPTKLLMAPNGQ